MRGNRPKYCAAAGRPASTSRGRPAATGRVGVAELRVRAQELQELLEAALEPDALDHLLHFAADARHFLQSDFVYLVGREVGGGEPAHALLVPVGTTRCVPDADRAAAGGQVLLVEELLQARIRREHVLLDRTPGRRPQSFLVCRRDRIRHLAERRVERLSTGSFASWFEI